MFNRAIKTNASLHLSNQNWNQKSPLARCTRGHGWWHMVMKISLSQGSPQCCLSSCCCFPVLDSSLSHREASLCYTPHRGPEHRWVPEAQRKKKSMVKVYPLDSSPDGALKNAIFIFPLKYKTDPRRKLIWSWYWA